MLFRSERAYPVVMFETEQEACHQAVCTLGLWHVGLIENERQTLKETREAEHDAACRDSFMHRAFSLMLQTAIQGGQPTGAPDSTKAEI